jgi:hypothetical protein
MDETTDHFISACQFLKDKTRGIVINQGPIRRLKKRPNVDALTRSAQIARGFREEV